MHPHEGVEQEHTAVGCKREMVNVQTMHSAPHVGIPRSKMTLHPECHMSQ